MSKAEPKKEAPKEDLSSLTAVYTGRKLGNDGKTIFQRFIVTDGKERLFRGVKNVIPGYTYRIGKDYIATSPERVPDAAFVDNPEWEAADALVDAANAKRRAEAKIRAKAKPGVKKAIEALRPLLRGISYYDRLALVEYLATEAAKKTK